MHNPSGQQFTTEPKLPGHARSVWRKLPGPKVRFPAARCPLPAPLLILVLTLFAGACGRAEQGGVAERLTYEANQSFNRGDVQAALEGYQRAVAERPDLTALDYNIGNVFHKLGRYDRAITESRKAAAGADDDVRFRAYYAIGNSYARQNKWREAYESYRNALVLNPSDADTKWNLEVALFRLNAEQQARSQQQGGDQGQGDQGGQQQPGNGQQQAGQQGGQQQAGGQQQQPGQQGGQQQPGGQQGGQQPPGGQQQPGQPGGQQPGGQQSGQQPGQQPGGQPGQGQAGQPGGNQPGGPGGSAPSAQELRDAIAQFERNASIEDALRVLDIIADQQRARQSQVPIAPPGSGVRDQ